MTLTYHYGTAMVLSGVETEYFLKEYNRINNASITMEELATEMRTLKKSEPDPPRSFRISVMTEDTSAYGEFVPFMEEYELGTKRNVIVLTDNINLIIWAENRNQMHNVIRTDTQGEKIRDALVSEMKLKCSRYFPDDFDWERHIGYIVWANMD